MLIFSAGLWLPRGTPQCPSQSLLIVGDLTKELWISLLNMN